MEERSIDNHKIAPLCKSSFRYAPDQAVDGGPDWSSLQPQATSFRETKVHQMAISTAPVAEGGLLSTRSVDIARGQRRTNISVHLADTAVLQAQANTLVNRMYDSCGYGAGHQLVSDPHRAIFTVCADDDVIGTLSLAVDSPAGLATDHSFQAELDSLRAVPGATICDLTKFAVDPATKSPTVLAALFHVIFLYGVIRFDCTDVVIEVHPRHVRYYEAMLGFKRLGPAKIDRSVTWWPSETPVQLMHLNLHDMRALIEAFRHGAKADERSLYPYFFSTEEEAVIATRIARLDGAGFAEIGTKAGVAQPEGWREAA